MRLMMILLMLAFSLTLLLPVTSAQDPCSGLVESRLEPGATARVVYNGDGIGSNLRDNPGREQSGSNIVGILPEGSVVTLLEGPVCLDGRVWWRVQTIDGREVWMAEGDAQQYFLEAFVLSTVVVKPEDRNLRRWEVTFSGDVTALDSLQVPPPESMVARDIWQQPDIDAANAALNDLSRCPERLEGTPWQGVTNAADVMVPEGEFTLAPSPSGEYVFLVRHWTLQIPTTCDEGSPGRHYGVSRTYLLSEDGASLLFPYGQHGGVRSREACHSPDVSNLAWTTDLTQIAWSPDEDTVTLVARYLDYDNSGRECAFYFIFMVDVFNAGVTPLGEGRRVVWAGGGTRLYYVTFETDNAYNILEERLIELSNGQARQVNVPPVNGGVQFVPTVFNSTGVMLPATEDGGRMMLCSTISGCPGTLLFEISRNMFVGQPIAIPDVILPRQVAQMHLVADDGRLLWLTQDGKVYLQSLRDPDTGVWAEVSLSTGAVDVIPLPTGIAAILLLESGDYVLLNTLTREQQTLVLN